MATLLDTCQPDALACLRRALARNRLPHGLVFASPGDVGETELARLLAQYLLCARPATPLDPCGECSECRMVLHGDHPDVHEIRPKGLLRAIKTDDMLGLIQALQQTSLSGGAKVGIIHQAESLRKESANRFLKTLEEPMPGTYFVLVTTRPERLLPTIRSRCQTIRLKPIEAGALRARAARELGLAGGDLALVAAVARGRWNRAARLAPQVREYRDTVNSLSAVLAARGAAAAPAVDFGKSIASGLKARRLVFEEECKGELAAKGRELADVEPGVRREVLDALEDELKSAQAATERDVKAGLFESLADVWRDVWVYKLTGSAGRLLHPFLEPAIKSIAAAYTEHEIIRNIADIDLVRGPTVYLNARMDMVLQGLLSQATMPLEPLVPLRRAIMATGL